MFNKWLKRPAQIGPAPKPTNVLQADTCATCAFVFDVPDPVNGTVNYCRRGPPTVQYMGSNHIGPVTNSCFPAVQEGMWCGEYQRRAS